MTALLLIVLGVTWNTNAVGPIGSMSFSGRIESVQTLTVEALPGEPTIVVASWHTHGTEQMSGEAWAELGDALVAVVDGSAVAWVRDGPVVEGERVASK